MLVPVLPSAGDSESQVVGAAKYQSSPGDLEMLSLSFATSPPQESPLGAVRQRTAWRILEDIHGMLNKAPWSFRQWINSPTWLLSLDACRGSVFGQHHLLLALSGMTWLLLLGIVDIYFC